MLRARSYGDAVAHSLGLSSVPSVRTQSLTSAKIAISRLSIGADRIGMTPRIPAEDTFILAFYLSNLRHHELWSRGRRSIAQGYAAGSMRVVNLSDEFSANITDPHETTTFYIPRAALDELAEEAGWSRISTFSCVPGIVDPVIGGLVAALSPALARPGEASALFVDQVVAAACTHLAERYGDGSLRHTPAKGGLSPYQVERAKEILAAQCERDISLAEVARLCGLSRSHFARAFHESMGMTPHRWRQRCRVEKAKGLLVGGDLSIADIALVCGFADQSHFTRVFSRWTGDAPAGWRRCARSL